MSKAMPIALFVLVVALSGCASKEDRFANSGAGYVPGAAAVAGADWSRVETVAVELSEFEFSPATLNFRRGIPYRLRLVNRGQRTHYFVAAGFFRAIAVQKLAAPTGEVEAANLKSIALAPGTTKELFFIPVETGEFSIKCTAPFHGLFGMVGRIWIV